MDTKYLDDLSLHSVQSNSKWSRGIGMFFHRNFNFSRFSGLGIMLLLLLATINMGQTVLAEDVEQKPPITMEEIASEAVDQKSSESIEEIIVYGDKSFGALRREVYKAEENFFDVFSSLNQDDEYDVRCFYEIPSFTHIRRHVCRANFVIDATSAQAEGWRTDGPRRTIAPAWMKIQRKKKRLRELMEEMVAESPELLQALGEYTDLRQNLESAKEKKGETADLSFAGENGNSLHYFLQLNGSVCPKAAPLIN